MLVLHLLTKSTYNNAHYLQIHLQIHNSPTSHLLHQTNNVRAVMHAHPIGKRVCAAYVYIARILHHIPVRRVRTTEGNHPPIISTAHIRWQSMHYYQISGLLHQCNTKYMHQRCMMTVQDTRMHIFHKHTHSIGINYAHVYPSLRIHTSTASAYHASHNDVIPSTEYKIQWAVATNQKSGVRTMTKSNNEQEYLCKLG
jgi:hypothetical protein